MKFPKPLHIRLRIFFETQNFEHIPVALPDFKKTYSELTSAFPEIESYENRFRFPNNTPLIADLITAWGEPDSVTITYWHYPVFIGCGFIAGALLNISAVAIAAISAIAVALNPGPEKKYIWIKGDYCILTVTQLGFASFYRRAILYWKWTKKESKIDNDRVHIDSPKSGE